jgi:WD40 repeat protein
MLAIANSRGLEVLYDTRTWQAIEEADLSPRQFISVDFSPDGKQLVTGEDGGTVQLWETHPLRPTAVIGRHAARIKSVDFSPDGKQVISAGDDKLVALWDVRSQKLVTRIGLHTAPVYAVAFAREGNRLISGGHDHSVRLYTRHRTLWGFRLD